MGQKAITQNTLFYGDNLEILGQYMADESVDLIYLDPPFNSSRNYNVLYKDESGLESEAQILAFEDTWHWSKQTTEPEFTALKQQGNGLADLLTTLVRVMGRNQMTAYLVMMTSRLVQLHRVLKPTGSLYLHCDPTASRYLGIILDMIFGEGNFRSQIAWLRSKNPKGSQHKLKSYSPDTDILLFYSKTDAAELYAERIKIPLSEEDLVIKYDRIDEKGRFTDGPIICSLSMGDRPNLVYEYKGYTPDSFGWRVNREKLIEIDKRGDLGWTSKGNPYRKLRPENDTGNHIGNCWTDISSINPQAKERLGYPTQKPLALLERIIQASSNPGDIVLDPFCGCGTAVHAAQKLGRTWIGIDITRLATTLIKSRLYDAFGIEPKKDYDLIGEPTTLSEAKHLATQDRYQFQWWALGLILARPLGGQADSKKGKKGADKGIDGIMTFQDTASGPHKRIIVQVKSGKVKSGDIRDLHGTIERENNAVIGVFITLENPSHNMEMEALEIGLWHSEGWNRNYPKIQILTIEQLLDGVKVQFPGTDTTLKQTQREQDNAGEQKQLM